MPQFKFCFHLESKMSAAAPASSLPWSGTISTLHEVETKPLFLCAFTSLDDMSFIFLQTNPFLHCFFLSFIMPFYDLFQLEMVCIVWEVCVFAHLPSYWMLSDDCSRFLEILFAVIEYSMLLLYQYQHKPQGNNMLTDCTNPDHSSHVGQTDSNPPDAAKLLTFSQNFKKVCPALCHRSHQESGRCDQFKVQIGGGYESVSFLLVTLCTWYGGLRRQH